MIWVPFHQGLEVGFFNGGGGRRREKLKGFSQLEKLDGGLTGAFLFGPNPAKEIGVRPPALLPVSHCSLFGGFLRGLGGFSW